MKWVSLMEHKSVMEGHIKSWQSYKSMAPGRWGSLKCEPSVMLLFLNTYLPPKKILLFCWIAPIHHPHPSWLNGSQAGSHLKNRDTMKFLLVTSTIKTCKVKGNSCFQGFGVEIYHLHDILLNCVSNNFQEKRGQSVCWILLIAMSIPFFSWWDF